MTETGRKRQNRSVRRLKILDLPARLGSKGITRQAIWGMLKQMSGAWGENIRKSFRRLFAQTVL